MLVVRNVVVCCTDFIVDLVFTGSGDFPWVPKTKRNYRRRPRMYGPTLFGLHIPIVSQPECKGAKDCVCKHKSQPDASIDSSPTELPLPSASDSASSSSPSVTSFPSVSSSVS